MPLHKLLDIVVGMLCALLFALSSSIHASTNIVFDETHKYTESAENFFYFEDQHGALSLQDALHLNDKDWSHLPGNIANFGFSESVYWFSFDLKNDGNKEIGLYVNVGYPLLDKIDFYAISDKQILEQYHSGDVLPFDARPVDYPSFLFPLSLSKGQSKTVLLRVESKGPIQVPLSIWKKDTFLLKAQHDAIGNLKRFQLLYENALEGIFSFDLKGNLLSANPAFIKLIGVGSVGYMLKPKEFKALLKEVRKTGQVVDFETTLHNNHEDSIWVNISARLHEDAESDIPHLEGTLININERKAFEQQMKYLAEHDPLTGFFNRRAFESAANSYSTKPTKLEVGILSPALAEMSSAFY